MLPQCVTVLCLVLGIQGVCMPGEPCYPSKQDFGQLDNDIAGNVLLPTESGFKTNAALRDTWFTSDPGAIAMVTSTEDIKTCVLFARKYDLRVSIKSSGHDYLGKSTAVGSLMINMKAINAIEINVTTTSRSLYGEIRAGTGNIWSEIYEQLNGTGRVVVGGSSPTVALGGYTQGGGHSPLSKKYGLAVDNVLEMEIVLSDGRIATSFESQTIIQELDGSVTTVDDGDLFWALRGGGGGTFGIVSFYTYKLHPDAQGMVLLLNTVDLMRTIGGGAPIFTGDTALDKLNALWKSLPDDYSGYVILDNFERIYEGFKLNGLMSVALIKFGAWNDTTLDKYNAIKALNPDTDVSLQAVNFTNFWDYQQHVPVDQVGPSYIQNSLLQESSFAEPLRTLIMNYFLRKNSNLRAPMGCTHTALGGAVGDAPRNSSPIHPGWRTSRSSLSCGVILPLNDEQKEKEFIKYGMEFGKELRSLGSGEYLNEADYYNENWKTDYWNDNYATLLAIKQRYDPDNFFTCYHCVGSKFPDAEVSAANSASYAGLLVLIGVVTTLSTTLQAFAF